MAANKITTWAKEHNIEVKVETQGSDGVKNRLTKQDIASATAIILATDVPIQDAGRFENVPHLQTRTQELIKHTDRYLRQALAMEKNVHRTTVEDKTIFRVRLTRLLSAISWPSAICCRVVVMGGLMMAAAKITGQFITSTTRRSACWIKWAP